MKTSLGFAIALVTAGLSLPGVAQDRFFNSNGVRIRYLEQGTGEPVVLIHGYGGWIERNWIATGVFQELAKNYRVIALDCRGHGKSDKPHDPKQYGPEMAMDVVRLLDELKIPKAHIIGYSMGGTITAKLLTMEPARFLTATLGGGGGGLSMTAAQQAFFEQLGAEVETGSLRTLIQALAPKDRPMPTDEQIKTVEGAILAGQDLVALGAVARSFKSLAITEAQVAAIDVPTLAIVGTADPNLAGVNKLHGAMPKLQVVTIDGATHLDASGRPQFIAGLQAFLQANAVPR